MQNGKNIIISISNKANFINRISAESEKYKLEKFISDPEGKDIVLNNIEQGEQFVAISKTTAPLVFVDGHYERVVAKEESKNPFVMTASAESAKNPNPGKGGSGNFTLTTTVTKTGKKDSKKGGYEYKIVSKGTWSKNSSTGGKKYPASGEDWMLQNVHSTLDIHTDYFSSYYNHKVAPGASTVGRKGKEFWREDCNDSYVKYKVKDDPAGTAQMTSCSLTTTCYGEAKTSTRKAYSYYVHTYTTASISVSVTVNSDKTGGLTLTPSKVEKTWQVSDYVTFNF